MGDSLSLECFLRRFVRPPCRMPRMPRMPFVGRVLGGAAGQ